MDSPKSRHKNLLPWKHSYFPLGHGVWGPGHVGTTVGLPLALKPSVLRITNSEIPWSVPMSDASAGEVQLSTTGKSQTMAPVMVSEPFRGSLGWVFLKINMDLIFEVLQCQDRQVHPRIREHSWVVTRHTWIIMILYKPLKYHSLHKIWKLVRI